MQFVRVAILTLSLLSLALGAEASRWWVELPRADESSEEPAGFPFPPPLGERALARRQLRGRSDRVEILGRGPDPRALRELQTIGVRIVRVSRWLSSASVEASPEQLERIQRVFGPRSLRRVRTLEGRRSIELGGFDDQPVLRRVDSPFDYGPSLLQNAQIGADRAHARGLTGRGINMLVLDTGFVLSHPALVDREILATYDFINDDSDVGNDPGEVFTQDRHGTGVVGVIAADVAGELIGTSPGVALLLAKTEVLSSETRVEEDNFVAALEWGEALGADVVSASLGYLVFRDEPDSFSYAPEDLDGDTAVTTRAIDDIVALGVVALTATGNVGPDPASLLTPADSDSGLSIGGVDANGVVANFSSRGPTADGRIKPDLVALAVQTIWADTVLGFQGASGTSLATPLLAGVVALLLEAHPEWGPGEVAAALRQTADQAQAPDNVRGWGLVDAHAAIFDLVAPVAPLPFGLLSPADSAVVSNAPEFRWNLAEDLQSPGDLDHVIEISASSDFDILLASFQAGPDTARTVGFLPTGTLWWRVVTRDPDGNQRVSPSRLLSSELAAGVPPSGVADWARWSGFWPNPTAGSTMTRLVLERAATVRIEVYDAAGRRIRKLDFGAGLIPGESLLEWDGRDQGGRETASGVYLLRGIFTDNRAQRVVATRRVVRIR